MLKKTEYVENEEDIKSELESAEWDGLSHANLTFKN